MLLHYYQCINTTARPLLFHVVQKRLKSGLIEKETDWKEGLTHTTTKVIEMCVGAARDTSSLMTIAAQQNLVGECNDPKSESPFDVPVESSPVSSSNVWGYMDCEHAFSATIVLILVCIAFPTYM